jgi:hypothetical protein
MRAFLIGAPSDKDGATMDEERERRASCEGFFLNDLDLGVVAIDGNVVFPSLILEAAIFERWTEGVQ